MTRILNTHSRFLGASELLSSDFQAVNILQMWLLEIQAVKHGAWTTTTGRGQCVK